MRLWQISLAFLFIVWLGEATALHLPQRREANAAAELDLASDSAQDLDEDLTNVGEKQPAVEQEEEETSPEPLGTVSIKSRAIAMDRGLCKELSRYAPHYPKCHEYCKKLDHWIGMCRRESCHCIS